MSLTSEQKILRMWDEQQIKKVMARYVYYSYGRDWEKVPKMFAQRDDIWIDCEGYGIFDGDEGIKKFFVEWHRSMEGDSMGIFSLHPLSTEIIEVAEDGKTARGLWISPGAETRRLADDESLEAFWLWGLYAIDFIKENDEWRFWHFRIPHLFLCDFHNSWVDLDKVKMGSQIANNGKPEPNRESEFEPTFFKSNKKTSMFFEPPFPHKTEEEISGLWKKKV